MKTYLLIFFLFLASYRQILFSQENDDQITQNHQVVTFLTRIQLKDYPNAFNPSLIKYGDNLLLTFRWIPDPIRPWINYIGVILLDDLLRPISKPQLLDTRIRNTLVPAQSEDARLFSYQGNIYILYNDNISNVNPSMSQRRDMFLSKLSYRHGQFIVSEPIKLYHQKKYLTQKWQKNWVPFEWHDNLLISYSVIPHEVLYADIISGECIPLAITSFPNQNWKWEWGNLRGGTPAILVDEEYLAFFHSAILTSSEVSNGERMHHYYMGAYTFSSEPPFEITQITPSPIISEGFYTESSLPKRVIFPGGFVVENNQIYLAYGKDDQEIWIASINKEQLKKNLVPIESLSQK